MQRFFFLAVLAALCLGSLSPQAQAGGYKDAMAQGKALYKAGKFAEAIPYFEQAVDYGEVKFGDGHPKLAKTLERLASTHRRAGNLDKAGPLFKRALEIWETAKGPGHPRVGKILNSLGNLYQKQGRYDEAEKALKRSLEVLKNKLGTDHPLYAKALNQLGGLYRELGRFEEAEKVLKQALAIRERRKGPEHKSVGQSLHNLANIYRQIGRYAESEDFYVQALAIREKTMGPDHPAVANTLNDLGRLQFSRGRFGEAETLYKRALAIQEKTLGAGHAGLAKTLDRLGDLYRRLKRFEAAEKAILRALAIRQRTKAPDHKSVGQSLHNLANLYRDSERPAKAEKFYPQGIEIKEKALGPDHPSVARAIADYGKLRLNQGKNEEAETLFKRALRVQEKVLGPEHSNVASTLFNLAIAQSGLKRPAESEALFKRALAIREKIFGPKHPSVASALDRLSVLSHDKGNSAEALDLIRRATSIRRGRIADAASAQSEARTTGRRFGKKAFLSHLRILSKAMESGLVDKDAGAGEGFEVVQFASASGAAKAVARMAARFAAGDDDLAKSVRQNQDAIDRWKALDKQLLAAVSSPPVKRNAEAEARWRDERDKLDSLIAETGAVLAEKFPEYTAMANPKPLTLADVRDLLGETEALLVYAVARRQSYLWVIRRGGAAMFVLPVTAEDLDDAVASLRADLDPTGIQNLKDIPPFSTTEAHALYRRLFAPAEELLKGASNVFVVPDRALESLPLGVLVTEAPVSPVTDFSGYQKVPWLAKRYALTVLPSVSSLSALRTFGARAEAKKPFTGFGDPDLKDGSESGLLPLPQTAGELKAMAKSLGAGEESIYLRGRATETAVKDTDLSDTRVLAFATHGLMAGDFEGLSEPALVMTPPAKATEKDDGLLTAGEVAQLKLNAEWVILSACNTAAPDGTPGAEGLSGLAKAFFYAGTRTLLVSHWPVESEAAVKLTTRMFSEAKDAKVGRAEALRRSMLALIEDKEKSYYAHPMFWAPFMVVGEGGTGAGTEK